LDLLRAENPFVMEMVCRFLQLSVVLLRRVFLEFMNPLKLYAKCVCTHFVQFLKAFISSIRFLKGSIT
jgi:hypothetical protein